MVKDNDKAAQFRKLDIDETNEFIRLYDDLKFYNRLGLKLMDAIGRLVK